MKIGIIREGKVPPDSRVPLTPDQCADIVKNNQIQIFVQPSPGRCYKDEEYEKAGLPLKEDLSDCDVLMGVKEVPIDLLIPDKTYFFFSHTIKKQSYNRKLLQACVEKNIRLVDYEVLTNAKGKRLIAFGFYAGMVGAHNGIMTHGRRTGAFNLPRMNSYFDYAAAVEDYKRMDWGGMKIVLTGTGRVGSGAKKVLLDMGVKELSPKEYLAYNGDGAVFTQLHCEHYVARKSDGGFHKPEFYSNPELYGSIFEPYVKVSDIMINGIYWDNNAPAFFTLNDMKSNDFNIKVIADVTCDIAPVSSIPSTIFASTIADPIFGFDPETGKETKPHGGNVIDMMTIDNLPNELPRDASKSFGEQFGTHILKEVLNLGKSDVINRASVTIASDLGTHYEYLRNYLKGEE